MTRDPRPATGSVARLVVFGTLASSLIVAAIVAVRGEERGHTSRDAGSRASTNGNATSQLGRVSEPSPAQAESAARRAAGEPGESERTETWDDTAPAVRVTALERDFETALDAIETGDREPHHARIAHDALSALRVELYGSERGRARHAALEQRLDVALEGVPEPASDPVADDGGVVR